MIVLSIAAVIGTLIGNRVLRVIPEDWFRRFVAVVILALGAFMSYQAFEGV